mmetsp:Transcript_76115/g.200455  ORF Transcript_76115/g.200455 Transcript_76115/m.200455 type:complete len:111 (+) Transcript_76115:13-345(+)
MQGSFSSFEFVFVFGTFRLPRSAHLAQAWEHRTYLVLRFCSPIVLSSVASSVPEPCSASGGAIDGVSCAAILSLVPVIATALLAMFLLQLPSCQRIVQLEFGVGIEHNMF